jgi:DNA-binding transcriptional ArsR family regulator
MTAHDGGTLRIHFTVDDLARIRMAASLGPTAESVFALALFAGRSDAGFGPWRREVRARLGRHAGRIDRLTAGIRPLPDLLWLLERRAAEQQTSATATIQPARSAVFDFFQVAVSPHWRRIQGLLEAERDARARVAITKGVEGLLRTLHPKVLWDNARRVLELSGQGAGDIFLDGRGILLSPSFFLPARTCVAVEAEQVFGSPALAFPVSAARRTGIFTTVSDEQALAALVGHTRAAVLETLTDSCTTGELSQRLGLSMAGASQHASILRRAGLITTLRNRNTALHAITPLGMALVRNNEPAVGAGATGISREG